MKTSRVILLGAALFLTIAVPQHAAAKTTSLCEAASSDHYVTKASGQFARGIINCSLCWVELFHQPSLEPEGEDKNLFWGLARGVGHTVLRLGEGVSDLFLCLTPPDRNGNYCIVAQDCTFGVLGLEDR